MPHLTRISWFVLFIALPLSKAIASISFGVLIISAAIELFRSGFSIRKMAGKELLLGGLICLFSALSLLYSEDVSEGLSRLYQQHFFLTIPLVCIIHRSILTQDFHKLIKAFVIANVVGVLVTFFFYAFHEYPWIEQIRSIPIFQSFTAVDNKITKFGIYSPFIDRLQFSYLIVLSIQYLLFRIYRKGFGIYTLTGLAVFTAFLMLLGARGAQLGLILMSVPWLVVFFYKYIADRFQLSKSISIGASALLLSSYLLVIPFLAYKYVGPVKDRYNQMKWELQMFESGKYVEYEFEHFTTVIRLLSWRYNLDLVKEHFVFGVGIGDFTQELDSIFKREDLGFPTNIHNYFLFLWGSAGIAQLLTALGLFICWLFGFRKSSPDLRTWALSFFVFYTFILLLDAALLFQVSLMAFMIFLSMIYLKAIKSNAADPLE